MHLLEDMGVPAHTRNDMKGHLEHASSGFSYDWYDSWWFYPLKTLSGLGNIYEYWVDEKIKATEKIGQNYVKELCDRKQVNIPDPFTIPEQYWDKEVYHTNSTEFDQRIMTAGLAEYTNANYLSQYAMFTENKDKNDRKYFPFPRFESVGGEPPGYKQIKAEDGQYDNVRHLYKKIDGEIFSGEPFAKYSYTWKAVNDKGDELDPETMDIVGRLCFILDDEVHEAYAKRLLPKTVSYAAGFLNYFFRGRLEITTAVPILRNDYIKYMMISIKNLTPTKETLVSGNFSISCRYTPEGKNPDGSDDKFAQSWTREFDSLNLGYNEEIQRVLLTFADPIPKRASIKKITLAFCGQLGVENQSVIGTVLDTDKDNHKFGTILMAEEWDNTPAGDNQWTHANAEAEQGKCSSIVQNGLLAKTNIRYAGYKTDQWNVSKYIPLSPILITPDSYIQFKVNEMFENSDSIEASQYIDLKFTNGTGLFFTRDGGTLFPRPGTGYYKFDLGFMIIDNICDLLKNVSIAVPEPPEELYLKEASFIQMMWPADSVSEVQYEQHMTSDFIQVIEGIHK